MPVPIPVDVAVAEDRGIPLPDAPNREALQGDGGWGVEVSSVHPSLTVAKKALRGFALVNRAGGKDLVLAGDAETVVARGDGRVFSFLDQRLPRAIGVWAADVTGDGVEDLALLESDTLRLFRGVPTKE